MKEEKQFLPYGSVDSFDSRFVRVKLTLTIILNAFGTFPFGILIRYDLLIFFTNVSLIVSTSPFLRSRLGYSRCSNQRESTNKREDKSTGRVARIQFRCDSTSD